MGRRLLFVDDEEVIRVTLAAVLRQHDFEVTTAATVAEALHCILTEKFDVLLSDLNIGNPGDGLTVVSAMRRTQPGTVTMILTGYPAFETALEAIRQQVDEYIVKPADIPMLVDAIESKLNAPPQKRLSLPRKRIAMVLQEQRNRIEALWLSSAAADPALAQESRHEELHRDRFQRLLEEVIRVAQTYSGPGVIAYKSLRRLEWKGYNTTTMLAEIRLLRRIIAQVIGENLLEINLSYLVPDLSRVNDCLDEQASIAATDILRTSQKQ